MKRVYLMLISILLIPVSIFCGNKINIVTTAPDFADMAKAIGGDKVETVSLFKGNMDPHAVEPRPSMVMKVRKADIMIVVGMDLDVWSESLIDAARNSKVKKGGAGYLDVSENIKKLEIPESKMDAREGHLHVYGNPHYWNDPENGKIILKDIYEKMVEVSPENREYFEANYKEYLKKLKKIIKETIKKIMPYKDVNIITFHSSWPYFAKTYGLNVVGFIEPKPSVPPSPSHILGLKKIIQKYKVKAIIVEPYQNISIVEKISEETGAKVVILAPAAGGVKGINTYLDTIKYNIEKIAEVLKK